MEVALGPWPGIVQAAARGGFPRDFLLVLFFVGFFLNLDCGSWRWGGRPGIVRGFVWVLFYFLFLTFCCGVFICLRLWAWQGGWALASLPCVPPRVYLIIKTNQKKKGSCALSWAVASMLCGNGMEPGEEEGDHDRSFVPFGHNLLLLSCAEVGLRQLLCGQSPALAVVGSRSQGWHCGHRAEVLRLCGAATAEASAGGSGL